MNGIENKLKHKMSEMYDAGFNPDTLIVDSSAKKAVVELFAPYSRKDIKPNAYSTDFGTVEIIMLDDSDIIILDSKNIKGADAIVRIQKT